MQQKHQANWFCPLAEPLFLKNVSTANARCSSDQRCMMTQGTKPSTQRCVFHCAIYTDVGMALNLNSFMLSAPPYIYIFLFIFIYLGVIRSRSTA
jgi:hypothetical protein